jgi:hypothetical protein
MSAPSWRQQSRWCSSAGWSPPAHASANLQGCRPGARGRRSRHGRRSNAPATRRDGFPSVVHPTCAIDHSIGTANGSQADKVQPGRRKPPAIFGIGAFLATGADQHVQIAEQNWHGLRQAVGMPSATQVTRELGEKLPDSIECRSDNQVEERDTRGGLRGSHKLIQVSVASEAIAVVMFHGCPRGARGYAEIRELRIVDVGRENSARFGLTLKWGAQRQEPGLAHDPTRRGPAGTGDLPAPRARPVGGPTTRASQRPGAGSPTTSRDRTA